MILLGHNGAGKSTLIQYLLGFYNDVKQHPFLPHFKEHITPLDRSHLGYAPEAAFLDFAMSAKEYLKLFSLLRDTAEIDVTDTLKRVYLDVDEDVAIKTYSKGMKQRLLLAIALLGNPKMIILDEPTSGLDPFGQKAIESLLISLKDQHEMIICTHSIALAHALDDEIWILKEGEIVYKGRPSSQGEIESLLFSHQPQRLQ